MDSAAWDAKYRATELIWGSPPNATLVELATALPAGRALDLACGEGRNALWLATRGWSVDAVDFSRVALEKASAVAATATKSIRERVRWVHADVTELTTEPNYDLVLVLYLHLLPEGRKAALDAAFSALKPEGNLVILGHDSANLTAGVGGPQDPEILYTPSDLVADLDARAMVTRVETVRRSTDRGTALDALLLASKSCIGSGPNSA